MPSPPATVSETAARMPAETAIGTLTHQGARALQQGRPDEAEALFRAALREQPGHVASLHNLGLCLNLMRRHADAVAPLQGSLAINPEQPDTWLELVSAQEFGPHPDTVFSVLYEALSYCHEHGGLLYRLASALARAGRQTEALPHYWHALRVIGLHKDALNIPYDLAFTLYQLDRLKPAEDLLRKIIALAPDHPQANLNLAAILHSTHRFREAERYHARVIKLLPADPMAHQNLGMTKMAMGDIEAGLTAFRRALALRPEYPVARSNLLLAALYSDRLTAADILAECRAYGALQPEVPAPVPLDRTGRRIRIGYVSGDFRRHVVGLLLLSVFAHHDRQRFEIHCYSQGGAPDPFTVFLRRHTDAWTDVRRADDGALAAQIRRDGIDILVDLSGHSADNRLGVFARRPAPVQVSWLGYPGSIGLPAIPWRITDAVLDPPGEDARSAEQPLRLPYAWFCYAPPHDWGGKLAVAPLPALQRQHITFGAFNNISKLSDTCIDLWVRVLNSVPDSRLVMRAKPFSDPAEVARFHARWAVRGIDTTRIDALPYIVNPTEHLLVYNDVDIHLDSMPYSGGATSCDALWMGVPVITLRGDRPSARLGASALTAIGLPEFIAETADDYVALASRWAADTAALARLRSGMRECFLNSPLHDAASFTRGLEERLAGALTGVSD